MLVCGAYLLVMTAALMVPSEFLPEWLRGSGPAVGGFGPKDKLLHAGSFAVLMGVWGWARGSLGRWPIREGMGSFLYGVATEIAQGLTGWRDAEGLDLVADSVGIVLGSVWVRFAGRRS
jgi:hypothetical protein